MTFMITVWVLDVKKVPHDLSGSFAKVGAPDADKDNSNPPEVFHSNVFLVIIFDKTIP